MTRRGAYVNSPGIARIDPTPVAPGPPPNALPDGVTERIVVMVAVLTHSMPSQIRVALSPTGGMGTGGGGWSATAMYAGADVATGTGRKPEEALIALEQRVARDATIQCNGLIEMLDAWRARTQVAVPYVASDPPGSASDDDRFDR